MKWQHGLVLGALVCLTTASQITAQTQDYFSGVYAGFEGGIIMYNTQITFDGVDDPAGRSAPGYGVFVGYNHMREQVLVGTEVVINAASVADPYTFDPRVAGFAALDLRRAVSAGLEVRAGYVLLKRFLFYVNLGYSVNKQSVRLDDVPLDQFAGGAGEEVFGAFQFSGGLEMAFHRRVSLRTAFRTLAGRDLSLTDFGAALQPSLTHFDVEPSQQQLFAGLVFRF